MLKRYLPILILVLGLVLFFAFDLNRYLSFEVIAEHYTTITSWVEARFLLAIGAFFILYIVTVAFSLPIASLLTLGGGAIFGIIAAPVIVLGASIGALILFLAARGAFADVLSARAGPFMGKIKEGFDDQPFFWLLALRLIPVAPFWVVNIVPALLGMRAMPYFLATLIGIAPGTTVYVLVGGGFKAVLSAGRVPDLSTLSKPEIILPLVGLGVLALIPIIGKRLFGKGRKK